VVSPEDLVLRKLTRRPTDYEVISRLVDRRIQEAVAEQSPKSRLKSIYRWALRYSFDPEALRAYALVCAIDWPGLLRSRRPVVRAIICSGAQRARDWRPWEEKCRMILAREMAEYQNRDSRHWSLRVRDLARLRRQGRLLTEGAPVE
jgi:hypothetical protein